MRSSRHEQTLQVNSPKGISTRQMPHKHLMTSYTPNPATNNAAGPAELLAQGQTTAPVATGSQDDNAKVDNSALDISPHFPQVRTREEHKTATAFTALARDPDSAGNHHSTPAITPHHITGTSLGSSTIPQPLPCSAIQKGMRPLHPPSPRKPGSGSELAHPVAC